MLDSELDGYVNSKRLGIGSLRSPTSDLKAKQVVASETVLSFDSCY
jgi:hypothetical protein